MKEENNKITEVEIYGELYKIVNNSLPEHTRSIAKYVDEKMKEISKTATTVSSVKVAVLAALNIADEMFKIKKDMNAEKELVAKETDKLYRLIHDKTKS